MIIYVTFCLFARKYSNNQKKLPSTKFTVTRHSKSFGFNRSFHFEYPVRTSPLFLRFLDLSFSHFLTFFFFRRFLHICLLYASSAAPFFFSRFLPLWIPEGYDVPPYIRIDIHPSGRSPSGLGGPQRDFRGLSVASKVPLWASEDFGEPRRASGSL